MKLLVVSDTHGRTELLNDTIKYFSGQIDGIIHAGDGANDFLYLGNKSALRVPVYTVKGNVDREELQELRLIHVFSLNGIKFLITHGNLHTSFSSLQNLARSNGAQLIVSGHTHIPHYKLANGILMINPGSLGKSRSSIQESCMLIDYSQFPCKVELFEAPCSAHPKVFKEIQIP